MIDTSSLVSSQFPEFYHESGENLIAFMRAYYEWLESDTDVVISAQLTDLRDIDSTVTEFLKYFKSKYIANLPTNIAADLRTVIKNSHTFYATKGTTKSIELLMRLVYDVEANVYFPSRDILKASDGEWYRPVYLEVTPNDTNDELVGTQIYGVQSGASALVESVVRKISVGSYFDVVYLSSVVGSFDYGEQITNRSGTLVNSPRVIGSLNRIQITNGGQNYNIGDIVEIISTSGRKGNARVTSIENGTGRVNFQLIDGGSGYTINAIPIISEYVYTLSDVRNANVSVTDFFEFETIEQKIANVHFVTANGTFANGAVVKGYTSGTLIEQANGLIVATTQTGANGSFNVFTLSGDFRFADRVKNVAGTTDALVNSAVDVTATANVVGSNATHIGLVDITNTLYTGNNLYITGRGSNTYANVVTRSTGIGATFTIGSLTGESTVFVNIDYLANTNLADVPFLQVRLDGRGSGACNVNSIVVGRELAITSPLGTFTTNTYVTQSNSTAVTANGLLYFANTTTLRVYPVSGTFNTSNTLIGPTGNASVSTVTLLGGAGYVNAEAIVFSGGGDAVTSVTINTGGTNYANGEHLIVTGDGSNAAIALSTNSTGGISSFNIVDGGYGYTDIPVLTVNTTSGTGANLVAVLGNLTDAAVATTNALANGTLQGFNLTDPGANYFNDPTFTISTGSGANVHLFMNYGYGFLKYPSGNSSTVFTSLLRTQNVTAGSIASLGSITPGENYNINPFVRVIEPLTAGFDARDLVLDIANVQGGYVTGETVRQTANSAAITLTFTGIAGNSAFEIGELISQGGTTGVVFTSNTTAIKVANVAGTFINTANVATKITGTTSTATANVANVASSTQTRIATGTVLSANASQVYVRRTSLNEEFEVHVSNKLIGVSSAANSLITSIQFDSDSLAMGRNAVVTANVQTANGIVTDLEITSSGFGYLQDEPVTMSIEDNIYTLTGRTILEQQGIGEGYWKSSAGFLNSDKYIHDGEYYQAYSYEIQTSLSLDHYADLVKRLLHVAGTKLFGKTIIRSMESFETSITSSVTQT